MNLVISGFGGARTAYRELIAEIETASGIPTVFVHPVRWGGRLTGWSKKLYPAPVYRQALHITEALERRGVTEVNAFAHSFGGPVALVMAHAFRSRVVVTEANLFNSACLHTYGVARVAGKLFNGLLADRKTLRDPANEALRQRLRESTPGFVRYISNPWRCVAEGLVIGREQLFDKLYAEVDANTVLRVFHGELDDMFPLSKVREATRHLGHDLVIAVQDLAHDAHFKPGPLIAAFREHGAFGTQQL